VVRVQWKALHRRRFYSLWFRPAAPRGALRLNSLSKLWWLQTHSMLR